MIEIRGKQAYTKLEISTIGGDYQLHEFLIDTGFNGTLLFFGDIYKLFAVYNLFNIHLLDSKRWLKIADKSRLMTYEAEAWFRFDQKIENVQILMVDIPGIESSILGMSFLEQNKKRLLLDFKNGNFLLD